MAIVHKDPAEELSGLVTLTGTPQQVREELKHLKTGHVVALTLEEGGQAAIDVLAQTVRSIVPLVGAIRERHQRETIESIVAALVPQTPPPKHALVEARMTAEARKAVLANGDWLTAAEVADLAGFSKTNPSAQPNKWKKDGLTFAIRHLNVDYFPSYALDPSAGYRPRKAMADVLKVFNGRKDDWTLAIWFASGNSFLGGKRPQDLLARSPQRVRAAAEDEVEGIVHG
jgi:hypothetical protein